MKIKNIRVTYCKAREVWDHGDFQGFNGFVVEARGDVDHNPISFSIHLTQEEQFSILTILDQVERRLNLGE